MSDLKKSKFFPLENFEIRLLLKINSKSTLDHTQKTSIYKFFRFFMHNMVNS